MGEERRPWEQQEGESNAAYARFLVYLNLGRTRSIDSAFQLNQSHAGNRGKSRSAKAEGQKASGTWYQDSREYHWVERALAKDIDDLTGKGYETVVDFINTLALLAHKTLTALASEQIRPRSLKSVVQMVELLGTFIPAETVAAVRADSERRRISAIGHSSAGSADTRAGDAGTGSTPGG